MTLSGTWGNPLPLRTCSPVSLPAVVGVPHDLPQLYWCVSTPPNKSVAPQPASSLQNFEEEDGRDFDATGIRLCLPLSSPIQHQSQTHKYISWRWPGAFGENAQKQVFQNYICRTNGTRCNSLETPHQGHSQHTTNMLWSSNSSRVYIHSHRDKRDPT